ncbi:hypothetical protein D3C74_380260 [compost metagenome]
MDAVHEAYVRVYELGNKNDYMLNSAIKQKDAVLLPPRELQEYTKSIKDMKANSWWR